jgi:hypothetical protein
MEFFFPFGKWVFFVVDLDFKNIKHFHGIFTNIPIKNFKINILVFMFKIFCNLLKISSTQSNVLKPPIKIPKIL